MQDIATIHTALTAVGDAAKTPDDDRCTDQRRVDALVDLCADILDTGAGRARPCPQQRRRPHVQVTVPLTALLDGEPTGEVAQLTGYGPITANQARQIAADATLRRLVCDPLSGTLLDYGRTTYEPPAALADHVMARDLTCVMPGAGNPPAVRTGPHRPVPARATRRRPHQRRQPGPGLQTPPPRQGRRRIRPHPHPGRLPVDHPAGPQLHPPQHPTLATHPPETPPAPTVPPTPTRHPTDRRAPWYGLETRLGRARDAAFGHSRVGRKAIRRRKSRAAHRRPEPPTVALPVSIVGAGAHRRPEPPTVAPVSISVVSRPGCRPSWNSSASR